MSTAWGRKYVGQLLGYVLALDGALQGRQHLLGELARAIDRAAASVLAEYREQRPIDADKAEAIVEVADVEVLYFKREIIESERAELEEAA